MSNIVLYIDSSHHGDKYTERISKSHVRVKGKILKVFIQRPWFKSNLFKSSKITTV